MRAVAQAVTVEALSVNPENSAYQISINGDRRLRVPSSSANVLDEES